LYQINPLIPCSIISAAFIVDKAAPKECPVTANLAVGYFSLKVV